MTAPSPISPYRKDVRTQMDTAYVGSSNMTNAQLDAIVMHVWKYSGDALWDDLLNRFVDSIESWWDEPTLRAV